VIGRKASAARLEGRMLSPLESVKPRTLEEAWLASNGTLRFCRCGRLAKRNSLACPFGPKQLPPLKPWPRQSQRRKPNGWTLPPLARGVTHAPRCDPHRRSISRDQVGQYPLSPVLPHGRFLGAVLRGCIDCLSGARHCLHQDSPAPPMPP